jgi:metallophosphoesterase superfamily enzyme
MLQLKPENVHLDDAMSLPVAVCGRQLIADNSGALYWPTQRTLLVADPPLRAAPTGGGNGDTPSGCRRTLMRLADAMDRYQPARVVVLGDVDAETAARMSSGDLQILGILQEEREWIWVTGRADLEAAPQLGGRACADLELSGLTLRHRPAPGWATHEIAGAMQPAARLSMYGYTLRRACFVGNGRRLVMPAFGATADGLNVLDAAFRPLFAGGGMAVWMLGQEGLYPVAPRFLTE